VLWLWPSSDYLLLPDKAQPVAPLVRVRGAKPDTNGGGIYFVAVVERRARLFEQLFPSIHDGATVVPASEINGNLNERQRRTVDLSAMARSQDIAAAVALEELHYKVRIVGQGALIVQILENAPAAESLLPGDVVTAVDGTAVRRIADLRRLIGRHRPGQVVRLTVRRSGSLRTVSVKTAADPADKTRPVIGVIVEQAASIHLPFPVTIDAGSIGGPSAGLAFALDLVQQLGRDVDRGYKIAATGELGLDGSVQPIGGVEQKTIGAREAHVDAFLVPAGDNARDARKYAHGLRIIPVQTFRQALRALATLPRKR